MAIPKGDGAFQRPPSKQELAEFRLYQFMESQGPQFLMEWKRAFPGLAKMFYIWSLDPVSEEAFREDYLLHIKEAMNSGSGPKRNWPDIYLKLRADEVMREVLSIDEITELLELGIFSKEDYKRIYEFLGGGK